ncbi:helix-turn-helix domain-containing protein [Streptomyces sp. RKAG337]|uniref:helix-turn-helix domain-containing protein n=1 Tax=Streptomyces sp. RKAG337 TaxID=2893404 RepID=UPI0020349192|nr:helix-turn-helix transcriptional regulator [Streptomyces sp. RKAG337]MCM2430904.1 helix-turn-helix domain-containing protein [Streptomyces sp. RKAG337]
MRAERRGVSNFDGRRLEEARSRRGWTPRELATEVGVTVTVLGQYEQGERTPELSTLGRLAGALGCATEDLRTAATTTLRDLRERAGAGQQEAATAAGLKRSAYAMLEQGRTKTLDPQVAGGLAAHFGIAPDAVVAAHAEAVLARAEVPAPPVLEGLLLERLAGHFAMTPGELLDLAQQLVAEGSELR